MIKSNKLIIQENTSAWKLSFFIFFKEQQPTQKLVTSLIYHFGVTVYGNMLQSRQVHSALLIFAQNVFVIICFSHPLRLPCRCCLAFLTLTVRLFSSKSPVKIPPREGGCTPQNFGWECAARFSKPRPYFRPKYIIVHTPFQTRPQKSVPINL